jgi:hypothetical protein
MDTHLDHEDYEHDDHEMVPMHSADFGDNGDDDDEHDVGNAVGAAALTGSSSLGSTAATTMRSSGLSAIEFNNVNVYVPPSFFQGCCGGAKGVPKHILRDISGRLQVRTFPFPASPPSSPIC